MRPQHGASPLLLATLAMLWVMLTFSGADASSLATGGGDNVGVGLWSSCFRRLKPGQGLQTHSPRDRPVLWNPLRLSGGGAPKKKGTKRGPTKGKKRGVEKREKRKWWEGGIDPAKGRLKFSHNFFKKTQNNAVKWCGSMPGRGGRLLLKPGSVRVCE